MKKIIIVLLILILQRVSPRNDFVANGKTAAFKAIPEDEGSLRSAPISGSSGRSLGKVKMSDSYVRIALHTANTVGGGRKEDRKQSHSTAGDDTKTINTHLEDTLSEDNDLVAVQQANTGRHDLFYNGNTSSSTNMDDEKRHDSIEPQGEEESIEPENDGLEQVEINAINISTLDEQPPMSLKFLPKCCSIGEILYLPSSPLRPVCELFEGPHLASPSFLEWGREGLTPPCRSGEQVEIFSQTPSQVIITYTCQKSQP